MKFDFVQQLINKAAVENKEELRIRGFKLAILPYNICSCVNLKKLDLSNNLLRFLPKGFDNLYKLEELNISLNTLNNIPENIYSLKRLNKLNVSRNKINDLSPNLNNLTLLKELNLTNNNIKEVPISLKKLSESCTIIWTNDIIHNPNVGFIANIIINMRFLFFRIKTFDYKRIVNQIKINIKSLIEKSRSILLEIKKLGVWIYDEVIKPIQGLLLPLVSILIIILGLIAIVYPPFREHIIEIIKYLLHFLPFKIY